MLQKMRIDAITIDATIQPRASTLDQSHADDLAEAIKGGAELPAPVVFVENRVYLLSEGFHRYEAHKRAGSKTITVDVRNGSREAALLHAMASNQSHGLKRTNADKRRAVAETLKIVPDWTDGKIAKHLGVGDDLVGQLRAATLVSESRNQETPEETPLSPAKRTGINGKQYAAPSPKPVLEETQEPEQAEPDPVSGAIPAPVATEPVDTPDVEARKPYKVPAHDKDGIPIQEWAVDAFEDVPEFRDLIRTAKQLRKQLTALADKPGGSFLARRGQWTTTGKTEDGTYSGNWKFDSLENFLMLLEDTMPLHTDCPYAHNSSHEHEGLKCITCRGLNWTPKQLRGIISKEIIASLFNHYGLDANV